MKGQLCWSGKASCSSHTPPARQIIITAWVFSQPMRTAIRWMQQLGASPRIQSSRQVSGRASMVRAIIASRRQRTGRLTSSSIMRAVTRRSSEIRCMIRIGIRARRYSAGVQRGIRYSENRLRMMRHSANIYSCILEPVKKRQLLQEG